MSTLATALSADLQALVDARLDTIDRMLMGMMPRADRLAIVEEVSSQIEEMLARKDKEITDREDVLEVLSRLDPPEAYLAEDLAPSQLRKKAGYVTDSPPKAPASTGDGTKTRWLGVIFGMVAFFFAFVVAPIGFILALSTSSEVIFYIFCTLPGVAAFMLGMTAIILEVMNPAKKAWNIVSLALAGLTMPMTLFVAAYTILILSAR